MTKLSMNCAGVDVSKAKLDVAVFDGQRFVETNDAAGHARLADRLGAAGVGLVGLEASGGYEAAATAALRAAGIAVNVFDPGQVHGYRRWSRAAAKTDAIDAELILKATAVLETMRAAPDPRFAPLQEHLTLIEALGEDIARLKTRRDRFTTPRLARLVEAEIGRLERLRKKEMARLTARVQAHADLAERWRLLQSIPGIGTVTALTLVVRMPELGHMSRGQAAAMAGLAPFNCDSAAHAGQRRVKGGRVRVRKVLFMAAFSAANHWNPLLVAFRKRLATTGKHHTKIIVACARKLLEIANAVLKRGTPWTPQKHPPESWLLIRLRYAQAPPRLAPRVARRPSDPARGQGKALRAPPQSPPPSSTASQAIEARPCAR
ncbi:MAG: IS110 family transposase [Rhizobiaceae bacterium]|nr:IS110 family transposase [Rhizobiaceae bacterium]MCV0405755.1 IS110 family transposase [Rhizobiaceae bacterium]